MFLKKIELQGFKSFADKTTINFESNVTGIVGPNGCGKSNVNDAIRWVLGEQSAKSLRGNNMSDVIFSGSAKRRALNMAEVTLVFDNHEHHFPVDFEEVSITRRLFRNSGEAEYLINNTPCRLKDIHELVMDSGLGKDSLSVISQGNITEFVESKPEDRRGLFEEAAGVSKYKKRKHESVNKLNKMDANLERVEDIVDELAKQVAPLKRQADKANQYLKLKDELEEIEISVIVDDVNKYLEKLENLKQRMFDLDSEKAIKTTNLNLEENQLNENRQLISELDRDIHHLQSDFMNVVNQISSLESRKNELDEKRKYLMEYASNQEKVKELRAMLKEAQYEYHDRESNLEKLKSEYQLLVDEYQEISHRLQQERSAYDNINSNFQRLSNRKEVLKNLAKSPFEHQEGVKNVLNSQLYGIRGALSQLLLPKEGYETALSYALGGMIYNIVCDDSDCAKQAIEYLKKNRGGRATFLPLNVLKPRYVDRQDLSVAEGVDGYLGVLSDFIECDENLNILKENLLGNVLVTNQINTANYLSKLLHHKYKIVTLDGDIVHKGGSMSGGQARKQNTPITAQRDLKLVSEQLAKIEQEKNEKVSLVQDLNNKLMRYNHKMEESKLGIAKLEPLVAIKKSRYEKIKDEYQSLNPDDQNLEVEELDDDLVKELSNCQIEKTKLENELNVKREHRFELGNKVEKIELQMRELRKDLNRINNEVHQIEIDKVKHETNLDNLLKHLSVNYEMTFEHASTLVNKELDLADAKVRVKELRNSINRLGNVNLDAPSEYEKVNERYEMLKKQRAELISAKEKILSAISEMDSIMEKQFLEMFNKINDELDITFKQLFGGGEAHLKLVDETDLLNTGIEVDVHPPGKNIKNMQQLSGGEKAMLALCVLFSIMKARTMPLCIFDEVEAALDQANVERFARYIGNFKGNSQFIVVSHRPGTMAQCDQLFGVTMHQDGVSKILSVKLNEAMQYVKGGNA